MRGMSLLLRIGPQTDERDVTAAEDRPTNR